MKKLSMILLVVGLTEWTARAQFSPGPNPISGTTGAQTLSGGTGTINSSGTISVSGSTVGVTMSGTSTLNNAGTIQAAGRGIRNNTNNSILTINNTGSILSTGDDAFQMNQANSSIFLTNSGLINSGGGQALDWNAVTTANNQLLNNLGGLISATGSDSVRLGTNGLINNFGSITATPTVSAGVVSGSDGVDMQTRLGGQITNSGTISGRHGITGGDGALATYSVTVTNNAGTISGLNGSGVNIDGVFNTAVANVTNAFGATIRGGVLAAATDGDGDGVDVDGVLILNNSGDILGLGAKGVGSDGGTNNTDAIAAGGGTIINTATGRIIGSTLAADASNGDTTRDGHGILIDDSSGGNAVAATSITNSGLIQGKTGYGVRIIGTFADTVTNNAGGTIRGANHTVTEAVIQTGGGNDTVTNAGSIIHDGGNTQTAIATEAGDDTVTITGNTAVMTGGIDGGSGGETNGDLLKFDLGAPSSTFSLAGTISNFEKVQVTSGTVNLTGANLNTGTTTVANGATLRANNVTGSATGTSAVTVQEGGTLGGNGTINGAVTIEDGGTLAAGNSPGTLTLNGGLIVEDGSEMTFQLGTISDQLIVNGGLTFAGVGQLILNIEDSGGLTTTDYDLINFDTLTNFDLSHVTLGDTPTGFAGLLTFNSGKLTLSVSAVPEPSTYALMGLGLLVLLVGSRLRKSVQV
jgi:hypothetical protein